MKMAARGLGKGLDALIPNTVDKSGTKSKGDNKNNGKDESDKLIKITMIEPNREQPRKNFDEDSLLELAESIKQFGLLQPILVQDKGTYYEIIAGERRWRAAKLAGLKEVPVIIRNLTEQEIVEISLIENIQREDLNPVEEAMAYQRLIQEYNLKQDEVAERVSKSRTAITNSIRLLKLDERVQSMLVEENISSRHARALLAIKDNDEQYNMAMKIFDEKLSVRETEKLIKSLGKEKKAGKKKEELKNEFVYRDLEEKLKMITGTKVTINRKTEKSGRIEIEYYTPEDLEKIIGLLNN